MKSATHRTFNNTALLGVEMIVALATVFATSIPLARILGPHELAYFTFIQFLAMSSSDIAMLGIPVTTRRYMAEAMGQNDWALARGVYRATLRLQIYIALAVLIVGEVLVFTLSDRSYWSSSWLVVLSLAPRMVMTIPSQVHVAAANLHYNLMAYTVSSLTLVAFVNVGLHMGHGLVGASLGYVVANTLELVLKTLLVPRTLPRGAVRDPGDELRRRMRKFSSENAVLLILNLVVWNKSDVVLLKFLRAQDRAQITFFSTAFNLADKAIQIVQVFVNSLGVSLYSELGRAEERIREIARAGLRYALLIASVLLLGLAAVGPALVATLYGSAFAPAGAVLSVAALFGIGKCVMPLVQALLQTAERQNVLVGWISACGALNVALDFILIPHHAALGAALANGIAQVVAGAGLLWWAGRALQIRWPIADALRGVAAGAGCALAAWCATLALQRPVWQLAAGLAAGALSYPLLLRLSGALTEEDAQRLRHLAQPAPSWARTTVQRAIALVAGARS